MMAIRVVVIEADGDSALAAIGLKVVTVRGVRILMAPAEG